MVGDSDVEAPKEFVCPLSKEIMQDPVIIASGLTYERALIKQWLAKNKSCPLTQQALDHTDVFPNVALKTLIRDWCSKHGIEPSLQSTANLSQSLNRIKIAESPRSLQKSPSEGKIAEDGFEERPRRALTDSSSASVRDSRPLRKSTLGSSRQVSASGDDPSPSPSPRSSSGQLPKARQGSSRASSSLSTVGKGSKPSALRGSSSTKLPAGGSNRDKRSPGSSEGDDMNPVWQRTMSWDERVKEPEPDDDGAEGPEFRRQLSSASTIARVKKGVSKSASTGHSSGGNRIAALRGEAAAEAGRPLPPRNSGHSKPTANDHREGRNDGDLPLTKSSSSGGSSRTSGSGGGGSSSRSGSGGGGSSSRSGSSGSGSSSRSGSSGGSNSSGSGAKRDGPLKKSSSSSKGSNEGGGLKTKSSGEKTREAAKSGSRRSSNGVGSGGGGPSRSLQRKGSASSSGRAESRRRAGLATSNSVAELLEAMDKGDRAERREASLRLRDVMRDSPGAMARFLDYRDAAAIAVDMMDEVAEDLLAELEEEEVRGWGACEGHCDVLESIVGVIFQLCEDYDGAAYVCDVGGIPAIVDVIDLPGIGGGEGRGGGRNGRSSDSKEDRREALVTQVRTRGRAGLIWCLSRGGMRVKIGAAIQFPQ